MSRSSKIWLCPTLWIARPSAICHPAVQVLSPWSPTRRITFGCLFWDAVALECQTSTCISVSLWTCLQLCDCWRRFFLRGLGPPLRHCDHCCSSCRNVFKKLTRLEVKPLLEAYPRTCASPGMPHMWSGDICNAKLCDREKATVARAKQSLSISPRKTPSPLRFLLATQERSILLHCHRQSTDPGATRCRGCRARL